MSRFNKLLSEALDPFAEVSDEYSPEGEARAIYNEDPLYWDERLQYFDTLDPDNVIDELRMMISEWEEQYGVNLAHAVGDALVRYFLDRLGL